MGIYDDILNAPDNAPSPSVNVPPPQKPTSSAVDKLIRDESNKPEGFLGGAADVVKSIPSSILKGISDSAGMFGPAAESEFDPTGAISTAPSSEDVQNLIEKNITGPLYKPKTEAGKIIGSGISTATNPINYLAPGSIPLKAGMGMLSGMGSEIGGEAGGVPGAIAGSLIGGSLPFVPGAVTGAVSKLTRPLTESGQQTIAGKILASKATDADAFRAALDNPSPEIVPGSEPTTFQLTGDMGIGALERGVAAKNPQEFMQRRADQNAARTAQLSDIQTTGNPQEVADTVRRRLSEIDQMTQQAVDTRLGEAQNLAAGLGGTQNQEVYGNSMRVILQDAENAARTNERALWNAVDPDQTLTMNTTPVRDVAQRTYGDLSQAATATLKPVERQILDVIGQYKPIEPFREITDLRSLVSQSLREELSANGRTPAYARLSQLRGGLENSVRSTVGNKAVADAANVAAGRMAPEQSLASSIQRMVEEWQAGRSGQNAAIGVGQTATPGTASISPVPGTTSAPRIGPEPAAGNPSIQEPVTSNFDEAAADRLRAATDASRVRAQTFKAEPLKGVLQRQGAQGPYNMPETVVPNKIFHSGDTGFEDLSRYRSAVGDTAALPVLRDYAASSLREAAMTPQGTIDPAKFAQWQAKHAEALRAFPDLNARFSNAATASEAVSDATTLRKDAMQRAQQGVLGKVIGLTDPQDITRNIGAMFGSKNSAQEMDRLITQIRGNPDAIQGLRKSVADYITQKLTSNTEAAASGVPLIKSDQFQTFIKNNQAALGKVFNPDEMASMRAIAADLQRANRSVTAVKLPGGSNTAQDEAAKAAASNAPSVLRRILTDAATTGGALLVSHNPIVAGIAGAGAEVINALRSSGYKKVDDLIKQALLDPALAKTLLSKVPTSNPAWGKVAANRIMRLGASTMAAPPAPQQRASGGRVRALPKFHPTVKGARLAPDGHYYLADPKRLGKFLKVVSRGRQSAAA